MTEEVFSVWTPNQVVFLNSWARLAALASFSGVHSWGMVENSLSRLRGGSGDTAGIGCAGWQIFKLKYIYTADK